MYFLCQLYRYGMQAAVYEQVTKDIKVSRNDVKKNVLESGWLAPCFGFDLSPSAALTALRSRGKREGEYVTCPDSFLSPTTNKPSMWVRGDFHHDARE